MMMLNKEYMINHMRNEDGSVNMKNVVFAAACEAAGLFQCLMGMDSDFSDWRRFIARLDEYLRNGEFETIHDICQTMYAVKNLSEELEGLYLVREDEKLCGLYYQVFVGMLDLNLFSAEAMLRLNGGDCNE